MATAATKVVEFVFEWEGRDRNGKQIRGETRAAGEFQVLSALRRQGVSPTKVKKLAVIGAGPVGLALALHAAAALPEAEVTVFDARPLDKDVSGDPRTLWALREKVAHAVEGQIEHLLLLARGLAQDGVRERLPRASQRQSWGARGPDRATGRRAQCEGLVTSLEQHSHGPHRIRVAVGGDCVDDIRGPHPRAMCCLLGCVFEVEQNQC